MATYILGRKQSSSQDDWLRAIQSIEDLVSRAEIDALAEKTAQEIRKTVKQIGKVAFAWSGGKDSQALRYLLEAENIETQCVLGICNLEYPAFLQWATDNMPNDLEIVNTGQDLDWLSRNLHMLFPKDAKTAAEWFKMVQHKAQAEYFKKHSVNALILGRRTSDGNYTGKNGIYTNSQGITRYSPLRDWKHEDILALVHYYQIPLPPCYQWPRGYRVGTGAWPARQWTLNDHHGWSEVYTIDPSIVVGASSLIPSANQFLETL